MRYVYGADGNVAATIDSSGSVTLGLDAGATIGLVRGDVDVFLGEAGAEWLGRIDADGRVFNARYEFAGSVDSDGRVLDVTGRIVGTSGFPVDGAALLLLVAAFAPEIVAPPTPPSDRSTSVMDEVIALADENAQPGVRKNYKPLTDEDVLGGPYKK